MLCTDGTSELLAPVDGTTDAWVEHAWTCP